MTKIIYEHMATTPEDFVKQEIAEWGFEYVDEMFDKGYEPTLENGVWYWNEQLFWPIHVGDNNSCNVVPRNGRNLGNSDTSSLSTLTAKGFLTEIAA